MRTRCSWSSKLRIFQFINEVQTKTKRYSLLINQRIPRPNFLINLVLNLSKSGASILIHIKYVLLIGFSPIGFSSTSMQSQLSSKVTWASCNTFNICYELKTEKVDIGVLANRYYTGPIQLTIYRKVELNKLIKVRMIVAEEGSWDYDQNQWILVIHPYNHKIQEFAFHPETIKN